MNKLDRILIVGAMANAMSFGPIPGSWNPRLPEPKPPRQKTQADHDRIAAAEAKRERKAVLRRKPA